MLHPLYASSAEPQDNDLDYSFASFLIRIANAFYYIEHINNSKSNLNDKEIWIFYTENITRKPAFYNNFFYLAKLSQLYEPLSLNYIDIPDFRTAYRLIVRKRSVSYPSSKVGTGQIDYLPGFVAYLPILPDNVKYIWLNSTEKVSIASLGTDALKKIFGIAYNTPPGGELNLDDVSIPMSEFYGPTIPSPPYIPPTGPSPGAPTTSSLNETLGKPFINFVDTFKNGDSSVYR